MSGIFRAVPLPPRSVTRSYLHPSLPQPENTVCAFNICTAEKIAACTITCRTAHPWLVKSVVLQAEEAASLAALQGGGCSRGQQAG